MGGAPPSIPLLSTEVAETTYTKVIEFLGIDSISIEDRIKALEQVSDLDLQEGFALGLPFLPVVDNSLSPFSESFELVESSAYNLRNKNCTAAMVVYSTLDVCSSHPDLIHKAIRIILQFEADAV